MLRACRRLLRPGGRLAFLTISVAPGLSDRDRRRAIAMGPRAVASRRPIGELLDAAGFAELRETDVTPAFLDTTRRWLATAGALEPGLRATLGDAVFDEQQTDRRDTVRAIEDGLLVRTLFAATAPGAPRHPPRATASRPSPPQS